MIDFAKEAEFSNRLRLFNQKKASMPTVVSKKFGAKGPKFQQL